MKKKGLVVIALIFLVGAALFFSTPKKGRKFHLSPAYKY